MRYEIYVRRTLIDFIRVGFVLVSREEKYDEKKVIEEFKKANPSYKKKELKAIEVDFID